MQKISAQKAFLFFTLVFVLIAVASFTAFRETEQACSQAQSCLNLAPAPKGSEILWEMVSRQFLSFLTI